MSLLARLAEDLVRGATAGMPTNAAERKMRDAHYQWLRTAELHRPYWTADAQYFWHGDERNPQLGCIGEYTFVERRTHGLYTATGGFSWDLFYDAGPKGLTTNEPPKPRKGQGFYVKGDLRDAAHPERWQITKY